MKAQSIFETPGYVTTRAMLAHRCGEKKDTQFEFVQWTGPLRDGWVCSKCRKDFLVDRIDFISSAEIMEALNEGFMIVDDERPEP